MKVRLLGTLSAAVLLTASAPKGAPVDLILTE